MKTIKCIQLSLVSIGVNLLIGCGHIAAANRSPQAIPSVPTNFGKVKPNKGTFSIGTSDSGGGNGIDGKVMESYIINPMELTASKKYLKQKIESLDEQFWKNPGTAKIKSFAQLFNFKKWYIAPVKLKNINKSVLGVSFLKNNVDQIAIQTEAEIWIDQSQFEKMTELEQAALIAHEYIMNLYMLKFMPASQMAEKGAFFRDETPKATPSDWEQANKYFPSEPKRPLNQEDYENIRYATGVFFDSKFDEQLVADGFFKMLLAKGFDRRLFDFKRYVEKEHIVIDSNELIDAISAPLLMQKKSTCFADGAVTGKPCSLDLQFSDSKRELVLNLTDAKLNTESIKLRPLGQKIYLSESYNPQNGEYLYEVYFYEQIENEHVGQVARRFVGYFEKHKNSYSEEVYILKTLTMISGVIVSLDKKYANGCRVEASIDPLFKSKYLVISFSEKKPSFEISELPSYMPSAMCSLQ